MGESSSPFSDPDFFFVGGFAHVYLVRLARPLNGSEVAVLKRVAVPDKEALTSMRTEVETMVRHIFPP